MRDRGEAVCCVCHLWCDFLAEVIFLQFTGESTFGHGSSGELTAVHSKLPKRSTDASSAKVQRFAPPDDESSSHNV